MVKNDPFVYIFTGEDASSKDLQLARLKDKYLPGKNRSFNLDTLYAGDKDLTLKTLQEKLLFLPLNSSHRIVLIRNAQNLKKELREFIILYARQPNTKVLLVMDLDRYDPRDDFIKNISAYAQVSRFNQAYQPNIFELIRLIGLRQAANSLRVLHQLLAQGERAEWILGALRSNWERLIDNPQELKRKIAYLLKCDLAIKRGRLKPSFALEKLIISLCGFRQALG
ncbi:MAG: hypothetical protein ABIG46_05495 [Candidatus Omnitrophota bacterium]|nr:hypothetical protein [Candidatus Omnitrophota bacterium]